MRIALLADGSLGDVLPYFTIAKALIARGHSVRLASSIAYERNATEIGAEFFPLSATSPQQVWEELASSRPTKSFVRFARHLSTSRGGMTAGLNRSAEACRHVDAVVVTTSTWPAAQAAVQFGTPVVGCHLSPVVRTSSYPRPIGPYWAHRWRLGPLWNWLTHEITSQLFWSSDRSYINAWRVKELGLEPLPWFRGYQRHGLRVPQLFGFSAAILPRPADWPEHYHITGYWTAPIPSDWRPPEGLETFLSCDAPLVFVGFGSHRVDPVFIKDVIVTGALAAGCRVILGKGATQAAEFSSNQLMHVGYVPYAWICSRVAVVVHHCGAGTVGEALRAGVPSVAAPFSGEQRFWGERLYDAGVSPRPLNVNSATAADVESRLRSVLDQRHLADRARQFRQVIASEDGVGSAVRLIEYYCRIAPAKAIASN